MCSFLFSVGKPSISLKRSLRCLISPRDHRSGVLLRRKQISSKEIYTKPPYHLRLKYHHTQRQSYTAQPCQVQPKHEQLLQKQQLGSPILTTSWTKLAKKYAADPDFRSKVEVPTYVPTQAELASKERVDDVFSTTEKLLSEARKQLDAPCVAPAELTRAEEAEKGSCEKWARGKGTIDRLTTAMAENNQDCFDEVMGSLDECEASKTSLPNDARVPSPPASPEIEWLRNVPRETKEWVRDSKKPWKEFRERKVILMPYYYPTSLGEKAAEKTVAASVEQSAAGMFIKRVFSIRRP